MGRKKSKKNMYFHEGTQDAIIKYNSLDREKDAILRSKIYGEEIHPAFDKLCENIINTFKFSYFDDTFEDVKNEVVAFLVMNIHKYDHTKGSKAFSYFSIVAKNYLILHNNANYKKYCSHTSADVLLKQSNDNGAREEYLNLFTDEIIVYFENNIPNLFRSKKDLSVAYAIIELFKQRQEIENFNKKALYVLIREMTNIETSYITKVVNVFKKQYRNLVNQFETKGHIDSTTSKFFR